MMAVIAYISNMTVRRATQQNVSKWKNWFSHGLLTDASIIVSKERFWQRNCRNFCLTTTTKSEYSPDYYEALGVSRSADIPTIKLAYFRKAKKFHPDTNKGEEARFMFEFIAEAYDVLSDERKRANYDEFGTAGNTYGGKANGPERPTGSGSRSYDSEELFMKIFGQADGKDANAAYQAEQEFNDRCYDGFDATREYVLPLSFQEAAHGCIAEIHLNLRIICVKCLGSKSEWGFQSNVCPYCEGTGVETEKIGHVLTRKTCSYCDGTRLFNKFKCHECAGTGQIIFSVPDYKITIPPGSVDGQYMKVAIDDYYMKHTGPGHPTHIYVKLVVEESKYFTRDGYDIYTKGDISVSQALLGGKLCIKGIHSDQLNITLPSNPNIESSHKTLVAPAEGIFISDNLGHGSHFIEVGIKVPMSLSEKQKALLLKIFELEDQLQDGIVENGVEYQDSHKFRTNVICPSKCERKFNTGIKQFDSTHN